MLDHFIIYLSESSSHYTKCFSSFQIVFTHMATHFMCWHDKDDFFTFTSVLAYKVYGLWSLNLYDLKKRCLVKWDFKTLFSSGILSSVNHNERFVSLPHKNSTKEQKNNFLQITVVLLPKNPVFPITIHFCLCHSFQLSFMLGKRWTPQVIFQMLQSMLESSLNKSYSHRWWVLYVRIWCVPGSGRLTEH